MPDRPQRKYGCFLACWAAGCAVLLTAAALLNAIVDPYLTIGSPRIAGFNAVKATADTHTALAKRALLGRARPATVMIGDSRTDIGLDPLSPAWPPDARPVFDDGIPGIGLEGELVQLREAAALPSVKRVLIVLDLLTLLMAPLPAAEPDAAAPAPTALPFMSAGTNDRLLSLLSIDALQDSLATLASQRTPDTPDLSDQGSTSDGGFRRDVAAESEHALFDQKIAALRQRFGRVAAYLAQHEDAGAHRLDLVAAMIATCREHGLAFDLVIVPSHAAYLDIIQGAGLWPRYEQAKADLVRMVAPGGGRLWDFEGYDSYSTEPVPSAADKSAQTQWYWEPAHFKKRLGELILATVFQGRTGWGARLTPTTIAGRLAQDEAARRARAHNAS